MAQTFGRFAQFADAIKRLPSELTDAALTSLVITDEPPVRIVYAPFDWINVRARVVICGITPGRDSMYVGLLAARDALRQGRSLEDAAQVAKRAGSFSNMRSNLSRMLDVVGLHTALGIPTTVDLFGSDGEHRDLLQTTSCCRYPVFVKGANYSGHSPRLMKSSLLRSFVENQLAEELTVLKKALIVPCGTAVDEALQHLVARRAVSEERCLFGFPHASGANGHRNKLFNEHKLQMTDKITAWAKSYRS